MRNKNINDHLANERTFLAWVRTSIAVMGLGFILVKFSLFLNRLSLMIPASEEPTGAHSTTLGIFLVFAGVSIIAIALFNYLQIKKQIEKEYYIHSSKHIIALSVGILIIGATIIWFLIQSIEK